MILVLHCDVFSFFSFQVIAAIGLTVHFEYRQFLHVASTAIKEIFHGPADAFWTGKAMDLLYNGIEIDCSTKHPLAKLACNEIRKNKNPMIQKMNRTQMKFSILGGVSLIHSAYSFCIHLLRLLSFPIISL